MCLDTFGRKAGEKVGMADCHGLGGNQVSTLDCLSINQCRVFKVAEVVKTTARSTGEDQPMSRKIS